MFSCCWGCLYFHLHLAAQIIEKGLQIFPPSFLPFFLKSLNVSFFFVLSLIPCFRCPDLFVLHARLCGSSSSTSDSWHPPGERRGEEAGRKEGRMWKGGREKEWERKRENMSKARKSEWELPKSVKERGTAACEVEDREEWEKEEEERDWGRKCSIGGSQGSISLLFLKRGSGGGWTHREREAPLWLCTISGMFGEVGRFPGLVEEQKCFCKKPGLGIE